MVSKLWIFRPLPSSVWCVVYMCYVWVPLLPRFSAFFFFSSLFIFDLWILRSSLAGQTINYILWKSDRDEEKNEEKYQPHTHLYPIHRPKTRIIETWWFCSYRMSDRKHEMKRKKTEDNSKHVSCIVFPIVKRFPQPKKKKLPPNAYLFLIQWIIVHMHHHKSVFFPRIRWRGI